MILYCSFYSTIGGLISAQIINFVEISRLKGCSGNNLGDGPHFNIGFSFDRCPINSQLYVTSIYNTALLPTLNSLQNDDTIFQVGSILCFVNDVQVFKVTDEKLSNLISSPNFKGRKLYHPPSLSHPLQGHICFVLLMIIFSFN